MTSAIKLLCGIIWRQGRRVALGFQLRADTTSSRGMAMPSKLLPRQLRGRRLRMDVSKLYGVKDPAPVLEVLAEGHESLSFLTLLAPDDALSLGDVTLVQKSAQVLEAVVQVRTQDGEGTDHIQVKADGLGVRIARVSEDRAPLWSTGNYLCQANSWSHSS